MLGIVMGCKVNVRKIKEILYKVKLKVLEKMPELKEFSSIKWLLFIGIAYALYRMYLTLPICFSSLECFFDIVNILNIALVIMYLWLLYKSFNLLAKDEKLGDRIKSKTEENLDKDNELKILEKEKLKIEISLLRSQLNQPKPPIK